MASLFGVLDTAGRGLLVMQRGIATTGHNIANAETPGYSRQRQVLAASAPLLNPRGNIGTGVEQLSIERINDVFVQTQLMKQGSALGATSAQVDALRLVEEVFNEQDSEGIAALLSRLYDGFSDLASAATPGAPVERAALRATASSLVDTLGTQDRQLRDLLASTNESIVALLPEINDLSQRIQELNTEITRTELFAPANDLRDQRDQLVRELTERVDVQAYEQPDGALVVTLSNGLPLVEGGVARSLVAVADPANPFNPGFAGISHQSGSMSVDVTAEIGGGRLGGLLRTRDTVIPAAIRSLDTIAYNLAVTVNSVHALGTGLNGATGNFFAALPAVEDAARDLALDANIVASSDAIAAGLTTAPSDNRNALALAALRDAAAPLFLPGDPPGPPSGPTRTVLDHAAAVAGDVGQQLRTMELAQEQQANVLGGLEDRRNQISGVSIDEEVTNLIQLQAAFQANSRVVSVVDRLLQDVLEMI